MQGAAQHDGAPLLVDAPVVDNIRGDDVPVAWGTTAPTTKGSLNWVRRLRLFGLKLPVTEPA